MYIRNGASYKLRVAQFIAILSVLILISTSLLGQDERTLFIEKQYFLNDTELKDFVITHRTTLLNSGSVSWFYLKPIALDYDNTKICEKNIRCVAKLKYVEEKIQNSINNKLKISTSGIINGPGTYLIAARDGSSETHYRLAIRRSSDYVGYITELFGVPFVYGPTYVDGLGHQTDVGLGADCIAAVIYGKRRSGHKIPYFAPPRLYNLTTKLGDSANITKVKIKKGDILHFGFQTAIISNDVAPVGLLDDGDMIIHSYHKFVEEVRFLDLQYRTMPFDVLRWQTDIL